MVSLSPAEHSEQLLRELNNLRYEEDFTDVTLEAGGVSIQAQKAVLASASHYFKAMFRNFQESKQSRV